MKFTSIRYDNGSSSLYPYFPSLSPSSFSKLVRNVLVETVARSRRSADEVAIAAVFQGEDAL
jgi:hypothetical protein